MVPKTEAHLYIKRVSSQVVIEEFFDVSNQAQSVPRHQMKMTNSDGSTWSHSPTRYTYKPEHLDEVVA